jgi:uncharacterized NAD(P)/FAD-binding protein YdhS
MNKEQDMNWQDTQKWADQKIAGLLAIAQRQGDKLIVGADPRDLLTTKEQQLELMQQQAINLRQRMDQGRHKNTRFASNVAKKPQKSSQDELFDLFAERLAKKLGELNNKKPLA